ncbi:hypothetical protein HZY62_18395 [Maribacter polysiphoniae]|uniref:Uncharacterized protein n=1 Tax=Maribacter polysiphoniae TaxID=429344 RepID=A0A316DUT5_9FLAO|nr:hypothetical protein [Maribacter polysiphoniae]PWK21228.1 hypothetical protein LX92_04029 [Maribacter polysiphoniae]
MTSKEDELIIDYTLPFEGLNVFMLKTKGVYSTKELIVGISDRKIR